MRFEAGIRSLPFVFVVAPSEVGHSDDPPDWVWVAIAGGKTASQRPTARLAIPKSLHILRKLLRVGRCPYDDVTDLGNVASDVGLETVIPGHVAGKFPKTILRTQWQRRETIRLSKSGEALHDGGFRLIRRKLLKTMGEVFCHVNEVTAANHADPNGSELRTQDISAMRRRVHQAAVRARGIRIVGYVLAANVEPEFGGSNAVPDVGLAGKLVRERVPGRQKLGMLARYPCQSLIDREGWQSDLCPLGVNELHDLLFGGGLELLSSRQGCSE